jgi:hypothetical protein
VTTNEESRRHATSGSYILVADHPMRNSSMDAEEPPMNNCVAGGISLQKSK